MPPTVRVLFLCTANSARSQMAEAILAARSDRFAAESAGVVASDVNPLAIRVLGEIGIDWSHAESTPMTAVLDRSFDVVVTVCDEAREACPVFPGVRRTVHWSFDDPAVVGGTDVERLAVFRRVRDEIAARIDRALSDGELAGAGGHDRTTDQGSLVAPSASPSAGRIGRVNRNLAPPSVPRSTVIVPPIESTSRRQTNSPTPVPGVGADGSTRRS
jgi:arsenate reductase (thioredoxin)